jgi:hypothetical protein
MTAAEKLALLQAWQAAIELSDTQINPIIGLLKLAPESPILSTVWGLQEAMTRIAAQAVGDAGEWLSWYAHENAMGAKEMRVGLDAECRPICTLEDLLWVVERFERGES